MRRFITAALFAATLTGAQTMVYAEVATDCALPMQPIIPDGNVASMDELVAAQTAFKAYQSNLVEYRQCLGEAETALDSESEQFEADKLKILDMHNASVDYENETAEQFNVSVRAYKARNPS